MPIIVRDAITDAAGVARHLDADGAPSYQAAWLEVTARQRLVLARHLDADGAPSYRWAELTALDVPLIKRPAVLINPYRFTPPPAAPTTPTLDTAVAWWTPADIVGSALIDQIGAVDLAFGGTPVASNDGTHNIVEFRQADSDYAAAASTTALDVTTGNFTVVIVARLTSDLTDNMTYFAKRAGGAGYRMRFDTAGGDIEGVIHGTTAVVPQYTAGTITTTPKHTLALRRNGSTCDVIVDGVAGTSATSSQDLTNSVAFQLARTAVPGDYIDMDFYGAAFFSSALSDAATADAGNELLATAAL